MEEPYGRPRTWVLLAAVLLLFAVWSNSFIAMSFLLGGDDVRPRFDWVGLTVARYLPAGVVSGLYLLLFRRREARQLWRAHWRRLIVAGFLIVPGYNLALYYGQQHGVPAPVASLTTALVPLFVMVLAAIFLGEAITRRRVVGFAVAAVGMVLISLAKLDSLGRGYPLLIAVVALAPLAWSIYSVLSKPLAGRVDPVVWTFLATTVGAAMVLPLLPGRVWNQWVALDGAGWLGLLYLSFPCTVMGFALWNWLLRHLPASSVGFTVFLNPPLTTASKYVFASVLPATFAFTILPMEWAGGALTLAGLALAVSRRRTAGGRFRPVAP